MNKTRLVHASAIAAIITIAFVVIITIWAELAAPLKDWLKNLSGHHWTSKSILSVLIYAASTAAFYGIIRKPKTAAIRGILTALLFSTVIGIVIITAFYTGHHFQLF